MNQIKTTDKHKGFIQIPAIVIIAVSIFVIAFGASFSLRPNEKSNTPLVDNVSFTTEEEEKTSNNSKLEDKSLVDSKNEISQTDEQQENKTKKPTENPLSAVKTTDENYKDTASETTNRITQEDQERLRLIELIEEQNRILREQNITLRQQNILNQETPVAIPLKPEIVKFVANKTDATLGDELTLSWEAVNAVVCAIVERKDITIPFVGHLPAGEMTFDLRETANHTLPAFDYYAICADKDWNTAVKEIKVNISPDIKLAWELNDGFLSPPSSCVDTHSPSYRLFTSEVAKSVEESTSKKVQLGSISGKNPEGKNVLNGYIVEEITFRNNGTQSMKELYPHFSSSSNSTLPVWLNNSTFTLQNIDSYGLAIYPARWEYGKTIDLEIVDISLKLRDSLKRVNHTNAMPIKEEFQPTIVKCN